jgi:16S rRNA (guanine527-N7)-methyltransferase
MTDGPEVARRYASWFVRREDEVLRDLAFFCGELARWQRVQNLVSRETLPEIWVRHIADSLQLLRWVRPEDRAFVDIGSGGGFPAVPLAIALKGGAARFRLIEPNQRKVAFLRSIARALDLPIDVLAQRADGDSRETIADVVTSRALAPLPQLLPIVAPFFGPSTRGLFHKGREYGEEMLVSRTGWRYDVAVRPSDTSADGVVLEMQNLRAEPVA